MTSPAQLLNEKLKRWNFFSECILWEFHSTRFGYGLDLSLNYVWDGSGNIREDALERPMLYIFRLLGVDSIRFSARFKSAHADPGMIDWGYGEVARVEAFDSAAGCGLSARWEGEQRLDVEFNDYILLSPEGNPL